MSAKQLKKVGPGRPATGITKESPSLTIDRSLMQKARKAAFKEGISLSAWVENAVASKLYAIQPTDP